MSEPNVQVTNPQLARLLGNGAIWGKNGLVFLNPSAVFKTGALAELFQQLGVTVQATPQIVSLWGKSDKTKVAGCATIDGLPVTKELLAAVFTDRDLYRAGKDPAHIFIVAPSREGNVELEIKLNGQPHRTVSVQLNNQGMAMWTMPELESGEYEVGIKDSPVKCHFQAAEYKLAALEATLEDRKLSREDQLTVRIGLSTFGTPLWDTKVALELHENGYRTGKSVTSVTNEHGQVVATFDLKNTTGNLTISVQVVDSPEKTAEVAIRGSKAEERKLLMVSPLGQTVETTRLPVEGARETRGLYFVAGKTVNTPFTVKDVLAGELEVTSRVDAALVKLVTIDPTSGKTNEVEKRDVQKGITFNLEVHAPWSVIVIGAWIKEKEGLRPWEGWSISVRPSELTLALDVPDKVEPGNLAQITVSTNNQKPVSVAVVVRDNRLTTTSSGYDLAQTMKAQMETHQEGLTVGAPTQTLIDAAGYGGYELGDETFLSRGAIRRRGGLESLRSFDPDAERGASPQTYQLFSAQPVMKGAALGGLKGFPESAVATRTRVLTIPILSPRETTAETLHAAVYEVTGSRTIAIPVGNTITGYTVEAFALADLNWKGAEASFAVTKRAYAEATAPHFVHPDDLAVTTIHVESESGRATVTVRVNGEPTTVLLGTKVEPGGTVTTPCDLQIVTGPAEINIEVVDPETGANDVKVVKIGELGKFNYRIRRLHVLTPGQTTTPSDLDAIVIAVAPGLEEQMGPLTHALASFEHKCCEQTASVMFAALIMALQGDKNGEAHFIAGVRREESMYHPGRGFRLYPESSGIDHHYGPLAAKALWGMKPFVNDLRLSGEMQEAVRKAVEMGKNAHSAYGMPLTPVSVQSFRDAYTVADEPNRRPEIASFVASHLVVSEDNRYLVANTAQDAVSKRAETAYAAAVLAKTGDVSRALQAANWVIHQFGKEGRLYSTTDSMAAMIMMQALQSVGVVASGTTTDARVAVNGQEMSLTEAVSYQGQVRSIKAVSGTVAVSYMVEITEDWDTFHSNLPVEVALEKDNQPVQITRVGDSLDLVVSLPQGYQAGDLVHVLLPPSLVWVRGGAQVEQITLDLRGKSQIRIPLAAVSSGKHHLAVLVRNMFREERTGNPGYVSTTVN